MFEWKKIPEWNIASGAMGGTMPTYAEDLELPAMALSGYLLTSTMHASE